MVVTNPALILPDEQSWALWGPDPGELGLHADYGPVDRLRLALAPPQLAGGLDADAQVLLGELAPGARVARLPGPPAALLAGTTGHEIEHAERGAGGHEGEQAEHDDGGHEGEHAEHDDGEEHDMMAIVGEPSADGLVMEDIELTHGPFGTVLPGGLELAVSLDGDVVGRCDVRARLRNDSQGRPPSAEPVPPDLLALAAWRAATDGASGRAVDLRSVERERALSHAAWLRALGRALRDDRLTAAAAAAVAAIRRGQREAAERLAELEPLLLRRTLRTRLAGRGVLDAAAIEAHGLHGPIARAAGVAVDARADDPAYRALGFTTRTQADGDVLGRARLRLAEAEDALVLAERLPAAGDETTGAGSHGAAVGGEHAAAGAAARRADTIVEGPRGPLLARSLPAGWVLAALGAEEARRAAGELVVGLEWGAALVVLCSLDLSPWSVGPANPATPEHTA